MILTFSTPQNNQLHHFLAFLQMGALPTRKPIPATVPGQQSCQQPCQQLIPSKSMREQGAVCPWLADFIIGGNGKGGLK